MDTKTNGNGGRITMSNTKDFSLYYCEYCMWESDGACTIPGCDFEPKEEMKNEPSDIDSDCGFNPYMG